MQRIDFTQVLKDYMDSVIINQEGEETTLMSIVGNALTIGSQQENISIEEKVKREILAGEIHKEKIKDMDSEQISMIKKAIGVGYAGLIVGPAFRLLDPPVNEVDSDSNGNDSSKVSQIVEALGETEAKETK